MPDYFPKQLLFKYRFLLLFRYDKANRSGDDCFEKIVCYIHVPQEAGRAMSWGHMGMHQNWTEARDSGGEHVCKRFFVVSTRKDK